MVAKLRAKLKQVYPFHEICDIIDGHFAKLDRLGIQSEDSATNDAALLQGVTFLVQALQQQQRIYQELDQKRERDYALSRRTASVVDSLSAHLTASEMQNSERGRQLTSTLEQLANGLRESADHRMGIMASVKEFGERLSRIESRLQTSPVWVKGEHFELENPDIGLLVHLAPRLSNRTALDIGSNLGAVSGQLLAAGYEVFAFEPFPPVFSRLHESLGSDDNFHGNQLAIGHEDGNMKLHIAEDVSPTSKYGDSVTLYHSLLSHAMLSDLQFTRTIDVQVRSLDSLMRANMIPSEVGVIKIDTEGYDLEVIRGMGDCSCQVLMAAFRDPKMVFGRSGARNRLRDLVHELRTRGYHWHIIVYRIDNKPISYYCNQDQSVTESWGNVIFFKEKQIFDEGLQWFSTVLPPTYFTP